MNIRLMLIVLMCTLSTIALAAPNPSSGDQMKILTCMKKAEDGKKSGASCIGIIADTCIASTSNGSKGDPKVCAKRELVVWSNLLLQAVEIVKKGGFSEINSKIDQAQQLWSDSSDTLCPISDSLDPGMVLGGSDYCRLLETGGRVLNLRILGRAVNRH